MPKTARIAALQKVLRTQRLPALLVSDPLNIRYLTDLRATDALLLVQQRSATLIVDGRYIEAAGAFRSKHLRIAERSKIPTIFSRVRRCFFEADHATVHRVGRWKTLLKNTKFVQTSGLVEGLRRKKDDCEIRAIRRARSITNAVIRCVPGMLTAGVTEKQVANRILFEMLERGADGTAFESIVAFGKHSSLPHHRAGHAKLRSRDIVQIDIGARVDGYCADCSEVFFVGDPTKEQRAVYGAVLDAKRRASRMANAGVLCSDIDVCAREILAKRGFAPYPHALGHGVGLDVHEGVVLSARSKDALRSGEVIAIEPGVYLPGKFGIRLEDTVFVT